jgi:predicted DNA-binding transcriptional regulator AlpA
MILRIPELDELITAEELEKITKISTKTWSNRRISGDSPPFIQFAKGGSIRYRWGDVQEWLNERKCTSTSDESYQQRKL